MWKAFDLKIFLSFLFRKNTVEIAKLAKSCKIKAV